MRGMQGCEQEIAYIASLDSSESSTSSSTSKFTCMGNVARVVLATALIVGVVALAIITGGIAGVAVGIFAGVVGGAIFGFTHMGIEKLENKSSTKTDTNEEQPQIGDRSPTSVTTPRNDINEKFVATMQQQGLENSFRLMQRGAFKGRDAENFRTFKDTDAHRAGKFSLVDSEGTYHYYVAGEKYETDEEDFIADISNEGIEGYDDFEKVNIPLLKTEE